MNPNDHSKGQNVNAIALYIENKQLPGIGYTEKWPNNNKHVEMENEYNSSSSILIIYGFLVMESIPEHT